jgi:hypothetical protein
MVKTGDLFPEKKILEQCGSARAGFQGIVGVVYLHPLAAGQRFIPVVFPDVFKLIYFFGNIFV